MNREYTDSEGYTLRVFSSGYLDWGVSLTAPDGGEVYSTPHGLSVDSYGFHWEDENGEPLDEGLPWTDEEWSEAMVELCEVYCESKEF